MRTTHWSMSGKQLYLYDDVEDANLVTVNFHDMPMEQRAACLLALAGAIHTSPSLTLDFKPRKSIMQRGLEAVNKTRTEMGLGPLEDEIRKQLSDEREGDVAWENKE